MSLEVNKYIPIAISEKIHSWASLKYFVRINK